MHDLGEKIHNYFYKRHEPLCFFELEYQALYQLFSNLEVLDTTFSEKVKKLSELAFFSKEQTALRLRKK